VTVGLADMFLEEAEDLVRELEKGLVTISEAPGDRSTLHAVFRAAHTLKSGAALAGFAPLVDHTHAMEEVLEALRSGARQADETIVEALLGSVDVVREMVGLAGAGRPLEGAVDEQLVGVLRRSLADADEASPDPADRRSRRYRIRLELRPDVLRTGPAPEGLVAELSQIGTLVEIAADASAVPPLDELDPYELYIRWTLVLETAAPRSAIDDVFLFVADEHPIEVSEIPGPWRSDESVQGGGEASARASARSGGSASSIRVDTSKLDRLMDLVGEMVISVSHAGRALLHDELDRTARATAVESLDQLSRDLQEQVMGLRMVPVKPVFERFGRLVHDLSRELGRPTRLELRGVETELDKHVAQQLADPLAHLVRNALYHGIEDPGARIAAGKPAEGTVRLQASQREGSILVEVIDDGRGIDVPSVLQHARARGLVGPDGSLPDQRVYALLFEPGMSTVEGADEVGGRGVGLDVVAQNIAELRGSVEVESVPGRGACFRMRLPLTMAIVDAMTVRVGDEVLCIPLLSIVQQLRPRREELKTVEGGGELVKVRGEYVRLARVHRVFGFETAHTDPTEALVVVVENEGRMYGALVDDVLGQEQAVVKNLHRNFRRVDGVAGATILGNGQVSMILDVHSFEQMAFDLRSGAPR